MAKNKKLSLSAKIIFSMFAAILVGILFNKEVAILPQNVYVTLEKFVFTPIGSIFINAIKMIVVPIVFVSLVNGVAQIGDLRKLGRVGGKTLIFYMFTTAIAITIGLILASIIKPGMNAGLSLDNLTFEAKKATSFLEILINMVPTNPIKAMSEGNMLQVIVFSILLAASMTTIKEEKRELLINVFDALNDSILKIITIIMNFAPIAVFCLITKVLATMGLTSIFKLALYMLTVLLALVIHLLATYTSLLYLFTRLNPIKFFKKFWPVMTLAFSTSTSNATIPLSMETADKKFGVKKSIYSFTLPLGATINMDGTAIMQGVATIFIAQLYNLDLSFTQLITVVLTATLASVGTAGVPGVGMITLSLVLQSVGLPVEAIALIIGIDRILDMCRTAINITGDTIVTLIVAKTENELDEKKFYSLPE